MENYKGVSRYKRIKDSFGRIHNYLRLSLTDRCNFRCSYCMPDGHKFSSEKYLLSPDEINQLVSVFTDMGVKKIRLTGGEPLVRKDFKEIAEKIKHYNTSLHLTTNGYLIDNHINELADYFTSINISLDTLKPEKFDLITKRDYFSTIWNNIDLALTRHIHTKLNVVVVKDMNHEEIIDFAELTLKYPLEVRFIEFMPFRGNDWKLTQTYSSQNMLRDIHSMHETEFLGRSDHKIVEKFRLKNAKGSFGFISTVSNPFCGQCNRIRITADGKLKNCLFGSDEYDLMPFIHHVPKLKNEILKAFAFKQYAHGGNFSLSKSCLNNKYSENRCMAAIGG